MRAAPTTRVCIVAKVGDDPGAATPPRPRAPAATASPPECRLASAPRGQRAALRNSTSADTAVTTRPTCTWTNSKFSRILEKRHNYSAFPYAFKLFHRTPGEFMPSAFMTWRCTRARVHRVCGRFLGTLGSTAPRSSRRASWRACRRDEAGEDTRTASSPRFSEAMPSAAGVGMAGHGGTEARRRGRCGAVGALAFFLRIGPAMLPRLASPSRRALSPARVRRRMGGQGARGAERGAAGARLAACSAACLAALCCTGVAGPIRAPTRQHRAASQC